MIVARAACHNQVAGYNGSMSPGNFTSNLSLQHPQPTTLVGTNTSKLLQLVPINLAVQRRLQLDEGGQDLGAEDK